MTRSIQGIARRRYYVLLCVTAVLLQLTLGCGSHAQFCCLQYDKASAEATYCNNHSTAIGLFLVHPEPPLSKAQWLDKFEALTRSIAACPDPGCIDDTIAAKPDFATFLIRYRSEHDDAEADLQKTNPPVTLSPAQKADLIRCGFHDAIDRSRENLKGEN